MIIHRFDNGDELARENKALIARFAGKRNVLSTAAHNGGFRENLKYVFNQDCKTDGNTDIFLKAPTYEEHMRVLCAEMGLEPDQTCGIITAADMENVSVKAETWQDTTVTAVVTAGIDENGGRVGDPASWHEDRPITDASEPGTINIMLFIDADLPEGTMAVALMTCTEAKTAALQELIAPSLYSSGIATGSGTDGTIVVSNPESGVSLTWAGKHSKLGELIGRTVMAAVKEALYLQTGLNTERQFDLFARIGRYGITKRTIVDLLRFQPNQIGVRDADSILNRLSKQNELVVFTSLYVHLLDQLSWGLIGPGDALSWANTLLVDIGLPGMMPVPEADKKTVVKKMLAAYKKTLLRLVYSIE